MEVLISLVLAAGLYWAGWTHGRAAVQRHAFLTGYEAGIKAAILVVDKHAHTEEGEAS